MGNFKRRELPAETLQQDDNQTAVPRDDIRELRLLFELCRLLDGSVDIAETLSAALELMARHMGMMRGAITLVSSHTGDIRIETSYGLKPTERSRGHYALGEGVTGTVIQSDKDILLPANHFAEKFSKAGGKGNIRLSLTVMDMLHRYVWPGNIRELENIMEQAVLLVGRGGVVLPQHLTPALHSPGCPGCGAPSSVAGTSRSPSTARSRNVWMNERSCIAEALEQYQSLWAMQPPRWG